MKKQYLFVGLFILILCFVGSGIGQSIVGSAHDFSTASWNKQLELLPAGPTPGQIAADLACLPGDEVVFIERLRIGDGERGGHDQLGGSATKHGLLTKQIGLGLVLEGRLDDTGAAAANT